MTEQATQPVAEGETTPPETTPAAGSVADPSGSGTQAPEGFVPLSELSATEERRRFLQSENDKLKLELARSSAAAEPPSEGGAGSGSPEFDAEAFRREMLRDVLSVSALRDTATALRTEFPHADPSLFTPDRLAEFGSPEALRLAASDSHARVATALDAHTKTIEEKLRAEYGEKFPGAVPASGGAAGGTSDPTPQQVAAMSLEELDALENANPGVLDRILRSE